MAMEFNHDLSRTGYRTGDCIDFATFNALIDNESIGDERFNFVTVRKKGKRKLEKIIKVDVGDIFTIRVYFHNIANPSLNDERKGTAFDARIHVISGAFYSPEKEWQACGIDCEGFMGYIDSSGTEYGSIRDFCVIEKPDDGTYEYIEGSAKITTRCGTRAFTGEAGPIGIGQLDGVIPPGESGYVEMDYVVKKLRN